MNRTGRRLARILAFSLFFLPVFFSCSSSSEKRSFNSSLDIIDSLINQHLYKEAVGELSKIEKIAYGSWAALGVFRRYRACDENERAEKFLVKTLKKNPENLELRAVYTDFLLRADRFEEALSVGKKLAGTKYGSMYSEAVFNDIISRTEEGRLSSVFKNPEYYPVYYDAWSGSSDNSWLRNCAVLNLLKGAYESASSIKPEEVVDSKDAYFWALVCFDAKRFGDSVLYLETAQKLLANRMNRRERASEAVKISLLESDALTSIGDEEGAEKIRETFIGSLEKTKDGWVLPETEERGAAVAGNTGANGSTNGNANGSATGDSAWEGSAAYLFTNSARWAFDNENDVEGKKLISFAVNTWPDFVPALTLYASFAWKSNLEPNRDFIELSLQDSGMASLEMERFDSREKIPLSDAVSRIEESLERTNDPLLYILRLDLKYKMAKNLSDKEKMADLWKVLEKNAVSPSVYPELMTDYALSFLLNHDEIDSAWLLYYRYVCAKYSITYSDDFFEDLIKKVHEIDSVSLEYGAYFAALKKRADDALALHELLVFEENEFSPVKVIRPSASDAGAINLALVYDTLSRRKEALDLYGKEFGRCSSVSKKSEIMFRMAELYLAAEDFKNARRCAEYAITLNKDKIEARLLLTRIKQAK